MSNIFFTSDTHFGHTNILQFCNRPFHSVQEMNEALINNWNNVVRPEDTVYHLGDFCFGGSYLFNNVISRLNGHIQLIIGNHDMKNLNAAALSRFETVQTQSQIVIENRPIYLNHYPFLCYGGSYRSEKGAVWQLFGHVHTCKINNTGKDFERLQHLFPYQYDVGVDFNNFTPISYEEVRDKINYQVENGVTMLHWVEKWKLL